MAAHEVRSDITLVFNCACVTIACGRKKRNRLDVFCDFRDPECLGEGAELWAETLACVIWM